MIFVISFFLLSPPQLVNYMRVEVCFALIYLLVIKRSRKVIIPNEMTFTIRDVELRNHPKF